MDFRHCFNMFSALAIIASAAIAQPDTLWTRTYGGTGSDQGYSGHQTSDDGYIIAGCTNSYGTGFMDVYLIKADAWGNELWTQTFGGFFFDVGYSVQQTSDSGYIIAGSTEFSLLGPPDVYLIKTDASGNELWSQTYGGIINDFGQSVQQTQDGGYIIAGATDSFGGGGNDVWLVKTDAQGNQAWVKTFGGTAGDVGRSVQQTSDGGYIIAGRTASYGTGGVDVYLIKTDASGNELWSQTYGGTTDDFGYSVRQTLDGGFIVAGNTSSYGAGGSDVYLIKTDASGNELWNQIYGGSANDFGRSVQQTDDGGYVITGYTMSYGAGGYDTYLIRTDTSGDSLWTRTYGGTSNDYGRSAQQTTDGGYVVAGYTMSYGAGDYDFWLIRLEGEGPPDLSVTLTPHDPPIQIPSSGGSFQYDAAIENTTAIPITADVWIEAIPPGGTAVPLIVRTDITFPASTTITRPDLTQNVPAGAPPGMYTYVCSVGEIFISTIDFDQFTFEKLATGEGLATVNDWNLSGWEDEGALTEVSPVEYALHQAYPNPFNPITTLTFTLPEAARVSLAVYNLSGRLVASLIDGWRDAGSHEVFFDGSNLASGVYLYRLSARELSASGKMVLMK